MNQSLQSQAALQTSLFNRAQEMATGKTEVELEKIAQNICATKGIDYKAALEQFKKMWNS